MKKRLEINEKDLKLLKEYLEKKVDKKTGKDNDTSRLHIKPNS